MRTESNGLLSLPPPYRSWVAISNDPDGTTMREWEQLHELLWEKLALPIADSFFLFNYSERYPDQVSVERHPEIVAAHPHDTMHTWGDFCDTPEKAFSRRDAERGMELLRRHKLTPAVWVDHASFAGNLLHNATFPVQPVLADRSGRSCANFAYSLDLIEQAGVRYVWDGKLTPFVGQDRRIERAEWYANGRHRARYPTLWAAADKLGAPLWRTVRAQAFDYREGANRQYFTHRFPDGRTMYCFRRHGEWEHANIDGLARYLDPARLERLARVAGTMVVYTHLGKRAGGEPSNGAHVPPATVASLQELASRYRAGETMVSSVSRLLDYLVLRDTAVCVGGRLDFRADGIRFSSLKGDHLRGFEFGVSPDAGGGITSVTCDGRAIEFEKERVADGAYRLCIR